AIFPIAGFIIAVLSALGAVFEATTRATVSRLLRLDSSQNVIGLIPHRPPRGEQDAEPKRRVVLSTHLDSPRTGWLDDARVVPFLHILKIGALACIVGIPIVLAVNLFVDSPVPVIIGAVL